MAEPGEGLSPHGRGNRAGECAGAGCAGSIPARAGEPPPGTQPRGSRGVYPRTGGGTSWRSGGVRPRIGLSPHGRGNRLGFLGRQGGMGSIPARAGEPGPASASGSPPRVYPRTGGGTPFAIRKAISVRGLSPHGRGNRRHRRQFAVSRGSIPARAGEPARSGRASDARGVYPRTGGGTEAKIFDTLPRDGVYPRTGGGTRDTFIGGRLAAQGSIPARAGEPRRSEAQGASTAGSIPARAGEPLPSNRLIMLNC